MNLWPSVQHLFVQDDGSLPDIFIEGLSKDEIVIVYNWLMARCKISGCPTLWSREEERDVPIREFPNAAQAFVEGRVESFRHELAGLSINGTILPDITVCVETEGLSFDYRKGKGWNEVRVIALFEFLRQIRRLVPRAYVVQADEGGYNHPNVEFSEALDAYVKAATEE